MSSHALIFSAFVVALIAGGQLFAEEAKHRWRPVTDEVYLQEVGRQIPSDTPVRAAAVLGKTIYVGLESGVRCVNGETLADCGGPGEPVLRMRTIGDAVLGVTQGGLFRLKDGTWRQLATGRFVDACGHLGKVVVAAPRKLLVVEGDALVPIAGAENTPWDIQRITSYAETLYGLARGKLFLFNGDRYDDKNVVDFGELPSKTMRDALALGNRLFIATDKGLGLLRGMGVTRITGKEGLCIEDTTCLVEGFNNDLWIGTPNGAIRMVGDEFHYFAGRRWLPDDKVNDIACGERIACIATDKGLGVVEYEPYTLLKKTEYYERWLEEWGQKRIGFVHKLEWDEPTKTWMREVSDNDGGWTAHYLAAQCFKYAVTGDEKARAEAVLSFNAMKWCEEATPIDGFPARAMWAKGETGHKAKGGSGGFPAEWHDTADGKFEWKADTSSDEVDAIFYAVAIFHDLAAKGEEKKRAKELLRRIAAHIIDNGWVLRDLDGKPTVWARWDPEYFASPRGFYALGLNGMEVLGFMKAAHAIAGDAKFEQAYKKLIDMGYLKEVIRQKLVGRPGKDCPPELKLQNDLRVPPEDPVCDFDDRLAWFVYYLLGTYEKAPKLRSIYTRSLERSWGIKRIEHGPWANFLYGALTSNDCEVEESVRHLREWPLDLVRYTYRNSHRKDLATEPGYVSYVGRTRAISPRETGGRRWTDSGLNYDGGGAGKSVEDPSGWIECYWMGRYYGFIAPPTTKDPNLLTVEKRDLHLGAKPYDGPPPPYLAK
ncbi:MAG: hypothetical protein JXQ73_25260 [Phycisphaerae bacterium]|nr:hypothetical protein [Phycisphaerae bacterium]